MICDHSIITDLTLDNKYILIYCVNKFIAASFTTNKVTSPHTVEVFDTAQGVIDRGLDLGLTCTPGHLIEAMEHGATLPMDVLDGLLAAAPTLDWDLVQRLKALEL